MDDMVIRAMAKWPNVPAVFGWLRLDRRGRWWIRDEVVQNAAVAAFIGRNYLADPAGRYFFQNGPQQVFVELDAAPWVLQQSGPGQFHTHTGAAFLPHAAGLDEEGSLYFEGPQGFGVVDERELISLVELIRDPAGRIADDALLAAWLNADPAVPGLLLWLDEALHLPLQRWPHQWLAQRFAYRPQPPQ